MKQLCAAMALLFGCSATVYAEQTVAPDVRTTVRVSSHDINRFVCPGTMQDLIYSKEKDITGHFSRQDAFIKFKVKQVGTSKQYATEDNELFLVCDGNVYTVIAQPTDIPSTTIRLTPPAGDSFKRNVAIFRNMPLEKQALHIIRQAYSDQYPSSYTLTTPETGAQVAIKPEVEALLVQYVDVEGVGLRLKRFAVSSRAATPIRITETDFLRASISPSLLAVAVEDHTLGPQATTRAFVVEHRGGR